MGRGFQAFCFAAYASAACTGTINGNVGSDDAKRSNGGGPDDERNGGAGGMVSGAASACVNTQPTLGTGNWRRLTQRQYRNTVKDLLGIDVDTSNFLGDSTTGVFETNTLPPQGNDIDAYAAAAEKVAGIAVADPAKLMDCNPATVGNDACVAKFIKTFGARAYRRELAEKEITGLTDTYNLAKGDGLAQGLRLALEVMLQSASFLYLTEFGSMQRDGIAKLSSTELATRLSYLLWNTMPDATLTAAAKAGELDTQEKIQAQARRLMADPRFASALADFHVQLFKLNMLTQANLIQKSNTPEFDPAMRKAMLDDVNAFVAYAVGHGQATVKSLFTAPLAFPSGPLLGVYKVSASQLTNGLYEPKDQVRAGLLTSPAFMATEPHVPTVYGAVQRGKMVRERLLCDVLPPPPMNLKFVTPPDAATTPQRALLEQHKNEPSCAGCHTLMDPIGFAFENYDSLGRYRTAYPKGETINPAGEVLGDTDVNGTFKNVGELSQKLAASQQVRACLGTHWFRYAYGREPTDDDACVLETFAKALGKGDGDLPSSLLTFVVSDAFRFRRGDK